MEEVEKSNANFNILNWWKMNSTKFLVRAQIARIVLAIHITIVASKSAFSIGVRVGSFSKFIGPKYSLSIGMCTKLVKIKTPKQ
jgi:hypothetical protein